MPKVSVTVPYEVALDPVAVRENAGPILQEQLRDLQVRDFRMEWTDMRANYRFISYGCSVQGTVDIQPNQIVVNVKLPWVAAMFKERIRKGIADGIAEALNDATP